ncbi:hypothetical protein NC651_006950 [Populus alba x Populus x berolinensis]|nr:hypothetical protein NC651_006950 [Populus alba x Populus x berolinensis]
MRSLLRRRPSLLPLLTMFWLRTAPTVMPLKKMRLTTLFMSMHLEEVLNFFAPLLQSLL